MSSVEDLVAKATRSAPPKPAAKPVKKSRLFRMVEQGRKLPTAVHTPPDELAGVTRKEVKDIARDVAFDELDKQRLEDDIRRARPRAAAPVVNLNLPEATEEAIEQATLDVLLAGFESSPEAEPVAKATADPAAEKMRRADVLAVFGSDPVLRHGWHVAGAAKSREGVYNQALIEPTDGAPLTDELRADLAAAGWHVEPGSTPDCLRLSKT